LCSPYLSRNKRYGRSKRGRPALPDFLKRFIAAIEGKAWLNINSKEWGRSPEHKQTASVTRRSRPSGGSEQRRPRGLRDKVGSLANLPTPYGHACAHRGREMRTLPFEQKTKKRRKKQRKKKNGAKGVVVMRQHRNSESR